MEAFPHNGSLGSTNTGFDHVNPSVSYDQATGDTYLFWDEILEGPLTNEGISGQKFNPAGDRQWGDSGLVVQPFTSSAVLNVTSVFTSTGPLIVWSSEAAFAQVMITGAKLDLVVNRFAPDLQSRDRQREAASFGDGTDTLIDSPITFSKVRQFAPRRVKLQRGGEPGGMMIARPRISLMRVR
jgi:hypothetical protein